MKDKATKRFHPKVMKARWSALSCIRVPSAETCSLLLEECVPPEYEELLQEAFMNSAQ